jgi:hypothetical protein
LDELFVRALLSLLLLPLPALLPGLLAPELEPPEVELPELELPEPELPELELPGLVALPSLDEPPDGELLIELELRPLPELLLDPPVSLAP